MSERTTRAFDRNDYLQSRAAARQGFAVPNAVVLMFVRGWQGGTYAQIAAELGVTTGDIELADYARMGELMRLAQQKRRLAIAQGGPV